MAAYFLFFVLMSSLMLTVNSYKECIDMSPTVVDKQWMLDSGSAGFSIVRHSRCNNCENDEEWKWVKGRGGAPPKKLCWKVEGETKYTENGKLLISFHCEYTDRIEVQNCFSDFTTTQFQGVNLGGKSTITHTDNSTYIAGISCMFGKENFWWVASHVPEKLSQSTLEEIHNSFKKSGFSAVTATLDTGSPVLLHKFTMTPC